MSVGDVKRAFQQVTQDRKIDSKDVDTVLSSAGSISKDEEKALKEEATKFEGMMDPEAKSKMREKLGEISPLRNQAAQINREIEIQKRTLDAEMKTRLKEGVATKSLGGSPIPEAVKKAVNEAIKNGAVAYDVREMKSDPVFDTSHGEGHMTIDGKFNPYAQDQQATDSMAFSHTELTPEKIAKDMGTTQTWQEQAGYTKQGNNDVATFKTVTGKPSGDINALYDEASWPDTMARGRGGQKYANNFAIMADGSFHAVPASRRTAAEPWRILTTASLGRGQQMLFNGHLNMQGGVVTYVGMSGRLCKLQEKGEAKFVDPIKLLQAWGFKTAPGLQVTNEG
jgi:hypothetical protein